MSKLKGKVCVVTGGAGSIGLASAKLFAAEGGKVMLVDRDPAQLAKAAKGFPVSENVDTYAADVADAVHEPKATSAAR